MSSADHDSVDRDLTCQGICCGRTCGLISWLCRPRGLDADFLEGIAAFSGRRGFDLISAEGCAAVRATLRSRDQPEEDVTVNVRHIRLRKSLFSADDGLRPSWRNSPTVWLVITRKKVHSNALRRLARESLIRCHR